MATENKDTTIVTVTRKGSKLVNELFAQVEFKNKGKKPLSTIPLDWEADPDNFGPGNAVMKGFRAQPVMTKIYPNMLVVLAMNLNKCEDFVNGMTCVVKDFDAKSTCFEVTTSTGKRLAVPLVQQKIEKHLIDF